MKVQYFNNLRFTRDDKTGYFINSTIHYSMHRYVWEYYNGPIPEGYVIHHTDGNRANNDISNLQCMTLLEHSKLHGEKLTQEERDWKKNNINTKARPEAIKWHKSKKGKEWHKNRIKEQMEQGRTHWQMTDKIIKVCELCGKEFEGYESTNVKNGHIFCSGKCHQKWRRINKVDCEERVCSICGSTFMAVKWSKTQTCSKKCAGILRWKRKGA